MWVGGTKVMVATAAHKIQHSGQPGEQLLRAICLLSPIVEVGENVLPRLTKDLATAIGGPQSLAHIKWQSEGSSEGPGERVEAGCGSAVAQVVVSVFAAEAKGRKNPFCRLQ